MSDLIDRQAAIVTAVRAAIDWHKLANPQHSIAYCIGEAMRELPSVQPDYKTDHGYMWLCPECGLAVHSDYTRCVRCGWERRTNG